MEKYAGHEPHRKDPYVAALADAVRAAREPILADTTDDWYAQTCQKIEILQSNGDFAENTNQDYVTLLIRINTRLLTENPSSRYATDARNFLDVALNTVKDQEPDTISYPIYRALDDEVGRRVKELKEGLELNSSHIKYLPTKHSMKCTVKQSAY